MAHMKICCIFTLLCALSRTVTAIGSSSANEISVLGGQGSVVTIYCSIPGGVDASSIKWSHQGNSIVVDGSKYRKSSNSLRISNIMSQDEGTYQCLFHARTGGQQTLNAACLYVLGKASFANCSDTAQFSCSHPTQIHVTAGQTIVLDTRIMYNGSGSSNKNQTTKLLQLFKGVVSGPTLRYVCTNTGINRRKSCPPKGRIGVVQGTDHKFDMKLTLDNAAINDTGDYIVRVEVVNPETGSAFYLTKRFQVNVSEPLPVKIQATGAPVAGTTYSLSCQITSESVIPTMAWLQSAPLTTGNGITISETVRSGSTYTLTLTFNPLQVQQQGNYMCRGVLRKDMNELTVMNNTYVNVEDARVVNVQASAHNATAVNLSWDLRSSGLNVSHFTIYCRALLNGTTVTNEFTINHSKDSNNAIVQIRDFTPQQQHQFQVSVTILVDGYGLYEVERSTLTDASTVTFDESLFQVKVGPIQHCSEWMMHPRKTKQVEKDIREAVAKAVSNKCNCDFSPSFIRPGRLSCRSTINQVVYRSTVIGANNNNSSMIVGFIEEWVQSSTPAIMVDSFILDVDPSCNVHISSLLEPECSSPNAAIGNRTLITTDEETIQCVNSCLQKNGRKSDCTL